MYKEISWPVCEEVLEAKYVEQADGQKGGFGALGQFLIDDVVDFFNDPNEQLVVDRLRDGKHLFRTQVMSPNKVRNVRIELLPALFHYLDEGVSTVGRLFTAEGFYHPLFVGHEGTMGQTSCQRWLLYLLEDTHDLSLSTLHDTIKGLHVSAIMILTSRSDAAVGKCSDLPTSLVSKLFSVLAGGNTGS